MDHDQRFKVLLQEFLPEFFTLFFPDRAPRFDFARVEWLPQELFPDPPQGDVLRTDLVAKLPHRPPSGPPEETVALIHVEIKSRDAVAELRQRMCWYYDTLRRRHGLPVLPVAVYLRVGLDGLGVEEYTESVDDFETLRFRYLYVGLPALPADQYLAGPNWLGVGLSALMKIPPGRKVWLRGEALRRVLVECPEKDYRKFLLCDCVEAYLQLDPQEQSAFEQLLNTEPYQEVPRMMMTTYEKGVAEGIEKGKAEGKAEGQRNVLRRQLEHRFGPLGPEVRQKIDGLPPERIDELSIAILEAASLEALGLTGGESEQPAG